MVPDSQTQKTFLFTIAFTLLLSNVSAAPNITIDSGDEVIWAESEDNTLNAQIDSCESSVDNLEIQESTGVFEPRNVDYNSSSGEASYTFTDVEEDVATYDLRASCENGNTSTSEFVVDSLTMSLDYPRDGTEWYIGVDNDPVDISFSSEEGAFDSDNLRRIDVLVDGKNVRDKTDEFSSNMLLGIRGDKLEEENILSSDQNKGVVELQVNSYYDENGDVELEEKRSIELNKWQISDLDVSPDTKVTSDEFSDLSLNAKIQFKGTPINELEPSFGPDNFYLTGYSDEDKSKWFSGDLVDVSTGEYSINLDLVPQKLDRKMEVVFDSNRGADEAVSVSEIVVEDVDEYIWSPKVLTPGESAVEADFKLFYKDGLYENFTSTNGDFSQKIWPGTHDLDITFPQAKLSLSDVKLDEENSGRNILYDYYFYSNIGELPNPEILDGIKPVNLLSVEFAYPFEKASIDMRYNNEQIDTSEDMRVYECTRWHSNDGECKSDEGWEQLSANDVTTVPASWKSTKYSTAKFSVEPYKSRDNGDILQNAYIVGTSADLVLVNSVTIPEAENGRVAAGSEISVEGSINSENENAVEGADVEVAFYQGDNEVSSLDTVQTDITGQFTATGQAPMDPGNYSIRLTADKENYNMLEREFDNRFETVIEEGIAVRTGSTIEVSPGEEASSDITVQNTGQTDMEDVTLSFEGLDSQYYSVEDPSFDEIPAGEEQSTEITLNLPSDYCEGGCGDWPSLEVSASATNPDGEEFKETESLQVQINRDSTNQNDSQESDTEQTSSETSETNNSGSSFSESVSDLENATGEFLASQSSLNMALGLIMVFMMVLAGAVKKQDNGGSRGSSSRGDRGGRGGRPRVEKPNVGGSEVQQVEPDQESEEDEVDSVVDQIQAGDEDVDSQIDAIAGSVVGEEQEDTQVIEVEEDDPVEEITEESNDDQTFVCEETGEEFDTKAALKLHRQLNGIEN